MPAKLKALHLATSMEGLKKLYDVDLKGKSIKMLSRTLDKIFNKAKEEHMKGDEEWSFVCYMRFLNIYSFIKKSEECEKNEEIKRELAKNRPQNAIDMAETLQKSLSKRYEAKQEKEAKKEKEAEEGKESLQKENLKRPAEDKIVIQPSERKLDQNGISDKNYISSFDIYKLLEIRRHNVQGTKESVLILDVRSSADFNESHMSIGDCINIPEEIVRLGKTPSVLEKEMPVTSALMWSKRSEVDYLVLMDWRTDRKNLSETSKIFALKQILLDWDPSVNYRSRPLILDGGYEDWLYRYPMYVTKSNVKFRSDSDLDDILDIDSVIYPSLHDETSEAAKQNLVDSVSPIASNPNLYSVETPILKPASSSNIPSVDRSSKAAALEKYNELKQQEMKIVRDSKVLADQQKQTEHELEELKKRKEVNSVVSERERALLQEIQKCLITQETQNEENKRLQVEMSEIKKRLLEISARQHPKPPPVNEKMGEEKDVQIFEEQKEEVPKVDSLSYRDHEKPLEPSIPSKPLQNDADEQIDTDDSIYHTQLHSESDAPTLSSGMKRSRSSPNIAQLMKEVEIDPKPSVPHFDRNIKPVVKLQHPEPFPNRQRNFSPVYGTVSPGLTGLKNLGNSCYMNCILQCISHTSHLTNYFCTGRYMNDINRQNPTRGEVAQEVAYVVRWLWAGKYRSIACRDFKSVVGKYRDIFRGTAQQDAHEFLVFLMDWLHNDLKVSDPSPRNTAKSDALEGASKAWDEYKKSNESFVLNLFFAQQIGTVRCDHCSKDSITYEEPTSNLGLILPNSSICTLSECLRLYTIGERISYNCESCKRSQSAVKKVDLWRLPPILIIHLKRFHADGYYEKRSTFVDFPLTNLDMREYTRDKNQRYKQYNLYGVSNHYGSLEAGHYTAHCRNGNRWYKFSDHEVSEISPSEVKTKNAYILFYVAVNQETPVITF